MQRHRAVTIGGLAIVRQGLPALAPDHMQRGVAKLQPLGCGPLISHKLLYPLGHAHAQAGGGQVGWRVVVGVQPG